MKHGRRGRMGRKDKGPPELPKRLGYRAIVDAKGGMHAFINAAFPTKGGQRSTRSSPDNCGVESLPMTEGVELVAPLHTAVCEGGCNHAYSHLMDLHARGMKTCQCNECREEASALHAQEVQEEYGVDLGLKASTLVERRDVLSMHDASGMHVTRKR
jgi:hypothetical protein